MQSTFDTVIDRRQTFSEKWDRLDKYFGTTDLLPLWVADMDFAVAAPIQAAIETRARHAVYGYTEIPPGVFDAVVAWLSSRHSWEIEPDWIEFSAGVMNAVNLAILAFSQPGDGVIIQPPVYPPFYESVSNNQRRLITNPLQLVNGSYQIDFVDLEHKITDAKMLIFCSPHNPVGRVWSETELRRLGELCVEHGVIIVSDEVHCDFVYPGHIHVPIATISPEIAKQTVTCMAPSKTFNLAGLATSMVIIQDKPLRQVFSRRKNQVGAGNGLFGFVALEAAYVHGQDWLDELLVYLEANRKLLLNTFAHRIPAISPLAPDGTYLIWLDCRQLGFSDDKLRQFFVRQAKVGLNHGLWFGPEGEGFQRINIACPRSILANALNRIEKAVHSL